MEDTGGGSPSRGHTRVWRIRFLSSDQSHQPVLTEPPTYIPAHPPLGWRRGAHLLPLCPAF